MSSTTARQKEEEVVRGWLRGVLRHDVDTPTIQGLLRGPLRSVLFSFLVPRVRSSEEINVIRGNIFAMGGTPSLSLEEEEDEEMMALRRELAEVEGALQQMRSDVVHESRHSRNNNAENVDDAAAVVAIQRGVIRDLLQLDSEVSAFAAAEESSFTRTPASCENSMNALLDESTELFRSFFFDSSDEDSLADRDASLRASLDRLSSSVAPSDLRAWAESGIVAGEEKISTMESLFRSGAVFDPVEVIKNEFSRVESTLTKEHLAAYTKAEELRQNFKEKAEVVEVKMASARKELIDATNGLVFPQDFANIVAANTAAISTARIPIPPAASTPPSAVPDEDFHCDAKLKNEKRREELTLGLLRSFPHQMDKAEEILLN